MIRAVPAALLAACLSAPLAAQAPAQAPSLPPRPALPGEGMPRAQVLMLGTFHFRDAGLDAYRPRWHVDVMAPDRQAQIEDLVERLAAFAPTRVAVEAMPAMQPRLDSLYREYAAGRWALEANEIYQIGFRLARRMGHERVYAVDASARWYDPDQTPEAFRMRARAAGQEHLLRTPWDSAYTALYRHDDSVKVLHPLREHLLYLNSPERVRAGHGHYLVGSFHVGQGNEYTGVDSRTGWYNRNLRIFNNLYRITRGPQERIVLVIGAGHLPLLRHAAETSPEFELVEPSAYLADPEPEAPAAAEAPPQPAPPPAPAGRRRRGGT